MEVVIDSVSIQHLLRSLKISKIRKGNSNCLVTSLDEFLEKHKLFVAIDISGGLVDEWSRTNGFEYISELLTRWEWFGALRLTKPISKINNTVSKHLRHLDTIDRLILRIALATSDRTVISNDSHFWDPYNPSKKGDQNSPIARLCREKLDVTILLLSRLIYLCKQHN